MCKLKIGEGEIPIKDIIGEEESERLDKDWLELLTRDFKRFLILEDSAIFLD